MMYVSLLLSFSQPSRYYELYRSGSEQYLGYLFSEARLVSGRDTRRCVASRLYLTHYFQGAVLGALMNMPLIDRFGLGTVSLKKICYIFTRLKSFLHQLLVVGSLFQIASCLVQFLQLSFPLFVLSFGIGGIGMSFQVRIMKPLIGIATDNTIFPS